MKWIKASERLPDKSKVNEYFNCKLKSFPAVGKFIKPIGQDNYTFDIDKYGLVDIEKSAVEWLDESIEEQAGEYWKQRCEAAEKLLNHIGNLSLYGKDYDDWQNLKNQTP